MEISKALNIDVNEKINIGNEDMTIYSAARWLALIRGIETIDQRARQLSIDLDKEKGLIKPLALQKYIEEDTPRAVADIKNLVDKEEEKCTTL